MIPTLKETLQSLFFSVLSSVVFAPIMIELLYRFNQVSGVKKTEIGGIKGDNNSLFMRIMRVAKTNGTPNMGGILIWILVPLLAYILLPMTTELKIFLIGFLLFGLWGFIDVVVFTNGSKNNQRLRTFQESFEWRLAKVIIAVLLSTGVMFMLYKENLFPDQTFFKVAVISATPAVVVAAGILGQFAVYSAEISDGLDGLLAGMFMIITACMTVLLLIQGKYEFVPVLGIIFGVLVIDLYFNIPPARFWNGGPGAMPLGFAFFFIGIATNNLIPYLLMSSVTWAIMLSSAVQILSMKLFKKRIFKIAPIHHHFQAIGWPQYKITMRFWLFTAFLSVVGIYLGII
jgi:phospho-N-acetylmuramoyl-pentapeptide-transferase